MFTPSETLIQAVRQFEGLHLKAYRCPAGIYTIGYGHTAGVRANQVITAQQADDFLLADLKTAMRKVLTAVNVPITQAQADALTDFVFNLGQQALLKSTLLRKINDRAPSNVIQTEFRRWIYASTPAGRTIMPGLVKRRDWEAQLWISRC